MPDTAPRSRARRIGRGLLYAGAGLAVTGLCLTMAGYGVLTASLPLLGGRITAPGLSAPVAVDRDAAGMPTVRSATRADAAQALGYLHAQERFFQMDLLRRSAAGELAVLFGDGALPLDRKRRIHRFRARAAELLDTLSDGQRRILDAYVTGVNQGLADLSARPFEYLLLRQEPTAWRAEDTLLVTWAMYFDLQDSEGLLERARAAAMADLGAEWAAFLHPPGTEFDAALDGSHLPRAPIPGALPTPSARRAATASQPLSGALDPDLKPGSNNWAVGGALTDHGGAIIANDMHLGHGVPNLWYRARLVIDAAAAGPRDLVGVTLPGTPNIVAGSNGHIAWGFTNSYIDTGDVIVLEPGAAQGTYRTPDGDRPVVRRREVICTTAGPCEDLWIEETIWGPVTGVDASGSQLVYRWVAHDMQAGVLGLLDLEAAGDVQGALAIAHGASIPNQNLMVGDRTGAIAWTIMGRIPRRVGTDGQTPEVWANPGTGWQGWLAPDETPRVVDPADHRLWSANARMLGGDAYALLGSGGYAHGARAGRIRDLLFQRDSFTEADLLAIQLDDRAVLLDRWQRLLLGRLSDRAGEPRMDELRSVVQDWGGHARPGSVGYRAVRQFRAETIRLAVQAYRGRTDGESLDIRILSEQSDDPIWRLLSARPDHLVPPGFGFWNDFIDAAIGAVLADIDLAAGGDLRAYTWGARNRPAVRHPLSGAVPLLGLITDPSDDPLPGDSHVPRVQGQGFGASQRLVVSPGREGDGILHMPGGQSGHPLSPYYLAGHEDWREGRPSCLLPGAVRWTLTLTP